jgi:hypothetical protein
MNDTPMTELPDGSGCCTATILSHEEAMALPLSKRPLNYRLPGDLYHAVFEAVGAASMCWDPRPSNQVFDSSAAEKVAMDLCFKIAAELDKRPLQPEPGEGYRILDRGEAIRGSDEFLDHGQWCCVSSIPCLTDLKVQNIKVRRKIDLDPPSQSASMPTG